MIRLKQLLFEMTDADIKRCLDKIKNKQFRLIGAGDNGRVYEIDDEDKTFKITKDPILKTTAPLATAAGAV